MKWSTVGVIAVAIGFGACTSCSDGLNTRPLTSAPELVAPAVQPVVPQALAAADPTTVADGCRKERHALLAAVKAYRAKFDQPPVTQDELVAAGLLPIVAMRFDLVPRADGVDIVPQPGACESS